MYKEGREGDRGPSKTPLQFWAKRRQRLTRCGEGRPRKGRVSSCQVGQLQSADLHNLTKLANSELMLRVESLRT